MKEKNETRKKQCDIYDPLVYDCKNCLNLVDCKPYLAWFSAIPHFVLDGHLMQISPSAVKVFLFLNRRAGFSRDKNFGKCWMTNKQLEEATGVKASNMRKYFKELQDHNLIAFKWTRISDGHEVKTIHEFTITHSHILRELDIK